MPRTLIPERRHDNYNSADMDGKNLKPETILLRLSQGEQLHAAKKQNKEAYNELTKQFGVDSQIRRERMNAALLFGPSVSLWPMDDVKLLSWKHIVILSATQIDTEVRNALIELLIWSAKHPESPIAISRQISSLTAYCYGREKWASHSHVLYLHARMHEIQGFPLTETEIFRLQEWERSQHLENLESANQQSLDEFVPTVQIEEPEKVAQNYHPLRIPSVPDQENAAYEHLVLSEPSPAQSPIALSPMKMAVQEALEEWLHTEGNPLALVLRRMANVETTVRGAELEKENEVLRAIADRMADLELENSRLLKQTQESEENVLLLTQDLQHVSGERQMLKEKLEKITREMNNLRLALGMAIESIDSIASKEKNV